MPAGPSISTGCHSNKSIVAAKHSSHPTRGESVNSLQHKCQPSADWAFRLKWQLFASWLFALEQQISICKSLHQLDPLARRSKLIAAVGHHPRCDSHTPHLRRLGWRSEHRLPAGLHPCTPEPLSPASCWTPPSELLTRDLSNSEVRSSELGCWNGSWLSHTSNCCPNTSRIQAQETL